jgi:hypothetical protein
MAEEITETPEIVVEDKAALLQRNLDKKAADLDLFVEKVNVSGALHTKRALLANKIGGLRSETLIKRDDLEKSLEKKLASLSDQIAEISADIRGHKPTSVEELHKFRDATLARFAEVEALIEKTVKTEKTSESIDA